VWIENLPFSEDTGDARGGGEKKSYNAKQSEREHEQREGRVVFWRAQRFTNRAKAGGVMRSYKEKEIQTRFR